MKSLCKIVYTSTAAALFERQELLNLLEESVQRNTSAGITGLLLYKEGSFMQVLEGEERAVKELFSKICRDSRYRNVVTLIQETIAQCEFNGSAMAFYDRKTAEKPPGCSDFLNTPLNGDAYSKDASKAKRLLSLFKKNIR